MSKQETNIESSATIFIVDDNEDLNQAIALNLETEGYRVKTFTSAEDFLNHYSQKTFGCLLLDVIMPGMTGDQLQAELIKRDIKIPIIFISGYSDVPVAVEALKNGAVDFLTKPIDQYTLFKTIAKALQQDIERRANEQKNAAIMERAESLTKREKQVMELIVKGKLNKIIADELDISVNTVENHRASLMHKLQAKTIAQLVCICLLNGLVDVNQ
jgi:FixJ family two-component response regulator